MDSLSIFFPFYNDAGTVEKMVADAFHIGSKLTNKLEVIAVNDGSSDHTAAELRRMQKEFPKLKVVTHKKNRGYGGALISGISATKNKWVFYTDGDAQYHLDELPKLWKFKDKYDVVNGYKIRRGDSFIRSIVGKIYRRSTKVIFNFPISDIDCDFRLMKGNIVRAIDLRCKSGAITVELVKKLSMKGAKFKELAVHHYDRVYGHSMFFTPSRIFRTIRDEAKLVAEFKKK